MPTYTVRCAKCGRTKNVYRPLSEWGRWPKHCGGHMFQVFTPPQIMTDIAPFKSIVTDVDTDKNPVISSRPQLRDFERRNKCHQIGDEIPKPKKWIPMPSLKDDLKRARNEVLSRRQGRGR